MNSINASTYAYNDFSFSMQTSSGDTINLKMYDEQTVDFSHSESKNSKSTTLSLSHAYGYSFEYQGDGIDANDKKEIQAAMKLIQPMLNDYFKNVSQTNPSNAQVTNQAHAIQQYLPNVKEHNTKQFLSDSVLKTIDSTLQAQPLKNDTLLHNAEKLFNALLKQMGRFELYM